MARKSTRGLKKKDGEWNCIDCTFYATYRPSNRHDFYEVPLLRFCWFAGRQVVRSTTKEGAGAWNPTTNHPSWCPFEDKNVRGVKP